MARGAIAYKGQLYLGGSKVEANPTGSATGGNLSKLGVDDTVYAIPQANNGTLTIQKNGTNVATFSANQSENVTANIDVSEDIAGTKTVSGNPITLTDASETYAESLSVELEPKQDLHGQSAPYVGGAGKNKLPMTVEGIKAANTHGTWSGNTCAINGGTFTILTDNDENVTGIKANGTFNSNTFFALIPTSDLSTGSYILSGCPAGGNIQNTFGLRAYYDIAGVVQLNDDSGSGANFTLSETKGILSQVIIRANYYANNLIFYPMVRLSTETDPTFAPYSNICPISGYEGVEVEDVGKNLISEIESGMINTATGQDALSSTVDRTKGYIPTKPSTAYTFSGLVTDGNVRVFRYGKDKSFLGSSVYSSTNKTFTLTVGENTYFIRAQANNTIINTTAQIQCEEGSTATQYEPYHSSNATIQFGQTVFGGNINFHTGECVVDRGVKTITGGESDAKIIWKAYSFVQADAINSNSLIGVYESSYSNDAITGDAMFNSATSGHDYGYCVSAGNQIRIRNRDLTQDLASYQTWFQNNTIQVCYKLAEPFTIQLTPQELKLLKQYNYITSNGTTINLGYQPDNVIGDAIKTSEEYTDRRMDVLGDLAYIDDDGDNSTKFLRGDGTWQNTPAGVTTLAALTDTNVSSPSNGQVLKYDGSKWVNSADYSLPTASAGTLGGVKVGANLSIDANGVLSATGGGATTLNGLTDVSAASPQNKQVLAYDSSQSKWVAVDADVVAIPRSYWSSTTRELDFMIAVPAYNTQRILKFSLMHNAGLAASEYMFVLDRGDVYASKMAGDTCGISSSYSSSTNTYTITITMPSVSGGQNFVFAMTMYNGSDKTW